MIIFYPFARNTHSALQFFQSALHSFMSFQKFVFSFMFPSSFWKLKLPRALLNTCLYFKPKSFNIIHKFYEIFIRIHKCHLYIILFRHTYTHYYHNILVKENQDSLNCITYKDNNFTILINNCHWIIFRQKITFNHLLRHNSKNLGGKKSVLKRISELE